MMRDGIRSQRREVQGKGGAMQRRVLASGAVALGFVWLAGLSLAADPEPSSVAAAMQRIFASLQLLLPASLDSAEFRDPARATEIRSALAEISTSAFAVAEHASSGDQGVGYLGRSLGAEARATASLFERGAFESAQFSILQMTEYCVECHSRSPAGSDSLLSKGFISKERFAALGPEDRARVQLATRDFDAGLDTLERLFASREVQPQQLRGALTSYLVISIRVKRNFERPAATLRGFAERPDLPAYLRLDVLRWVDALGSLSRRARSSPPPRIEDAAEVLSEARDLMRFPSDRQALVHYIVATALLQRVLENPATDAKKARAYYLLGLAELRIGRSYWLGLSEFLLETAIRLDPGGDAARQAYALIEEETLYTYSLGVSDGGVVDERKVPELPLEVEQRLADLRRAIESASGERAPDRTPRQR
jgi:hypothetical protein